MLAQRLTLGFPESQVWEVGAVMDPVKRDSEGPIQIPASLGEKLQWSSPKDSSPDEIETPEEPQPEDSQNKSGDRPPQPRER